MSILRDVVKILCTFLFNIFCYIILLYTGFVTNYLWHTLYLFLFYIYDDVCWYSPISPCVVSFLSLYTCFYMNAILYFSFTLGCLDEFCLKCFRKTGCQNLSCHELSSCKIFQEFVIGLYLLYSTSDYEFSDLWLLSYFICLLWFCHGSPKGEIVRTYVILLEAYVM